MRRQRGFTLLEVILAFTLLAASLGILIAILSGGLAQVKNAGDASEASLHAQSLIDEVGVLEVIEPLRSSGNFERGRYRWNLEITEVDDPVPTVVPDTGAPPAESVGLQLGAPVVYRVQVDVEWGEGEYARNVSFATLRVRTPVAAAGVVP